MLRAKYPQAYFPGHREQVGCRCYRRLWPLVFARGNYGQAGTAGPISAPAASRSSVRSDITSSMRSFGCCSANPGRRGMTSRIPNAPDSATRNVPRRPSAPRAAFSVVEIAEDLPGPFQKHPAGVGRRDVPRGAQEKQLHTSRASRLAAIRDIDGCDTPSSRATREKLPVSPARMKAVNSSRRSLIQLAYKSDARLSSTAPSLRPHVGWQADQLVRWVNGTEEGVRR